MRIAVLIITLLCSQSILAAKAGIDGGGGKGVACKDEQGQVTKVQVLDIYEGINLHGFDYSDLEGKSPMEVGHEGLAHLMKSMEGPKGSSMLNWWRAGFKNIDKRIKMLRGNNLLKPITDFEVDYILPENCYFVQLAMVKPHSPPLIVEYFWKKMDNINRGALLLHEKIYSSERGWHGIEHSNRIRGIVAYSLAKVKFAPTLNGNPDTSGFYRCYSESRTINFLVRDNNEFRKPDEMKMTSFFFEVLGVTVPAMTIGAMIDIDIKGLLTGQKIDEHSVVATVFGYEYIEIKNGPDGFFMRLIGEKLKGTDPLHKITCIPEDEL